MTTPVSNTISTVSQLILAVCALGALCLSFWKAAKPVDVKLRILRVLLELTCVAALLMCGYLLIATDRWGLASLCALYVFLVQYGIFLASPNPATRIEILTIILTAVFAGCIPLYGAISAMLKMQSRMVHIEDRVVSVLEKLTTKPRPSPSPSAVPHNP